MVGKEGIDCLRMPIGRTLDDFDERRWSGRRDSLSLVPITISKFCIGSALNQTLNWTCALGCEALTGHWQRSRLFHRADRDVAAHVRNARQLQNRLDEQSLVCS
jgi:hypothetical protein